MTGIIQLFDRVYLDRQFASGERGLMVFFPFGRGRRGYIVPADKGDDIRRALRLQIFASCVAALSLAVLVLSMILEPSSRETWFDWLALALWFVCLAVFMIYARFSLVRGLERASMREYAGALETTPDAGPRKT